MAKNIDKSIPRQLRDAKAEIKELHEILDRSQQRVNESESKVQSADQLRVALYNGFVQERTELLARVQRVENRIHALGYGVPVMTKVTSQ